MTSGKNLRSGIEHANDLLLCHNVLDTQDLQWQKLTYLAPSKTCHVSDVSVSYHPYIRFSHMAHWNVDTLKLYLER